MQATNLRSLMAVTDAGRRNQVYQAWRTTLQLESLALVYFLRDQIVRFLIWCCSGDRRDYHGQPMTVWTFNSEDIKWVGFTGELLEVLRVSNNEQLLAAPTGLVNRAEHGDYFDEQFWTLVELLTADGFGLRLEEYPQGRQLTLGFLDEG